MAERRMFAKSVVDSDSFMSLPFSAQAVYVHLAMRADDDGFIGNAKSILRMVGGGNKELTLLAEQGYIRVFDSGVVGVVHWKINNYIQKDRYKPSIYRKEKALMYPDEDKNEDKITDEDFSVSDLDTQVRLGKDSIGKDSIGKGSLGEDSLGKVSTDKEKAAKANSVQIKQEDLYSGKKSSTNRADNNSVSDGECLKIIDLYNSICISLTQVSTLTPGRKFYISLLLQKYGKEQIEEVFRKAQSCDFLKGQGERGWKASFDWLMYEGNFLKVLEGAYDTEQKGEPCSYDLEAYEKYSMFD